MSHPPVYRMAPATSSWVESLPKRIGLFLLRVPTDRWLMALVTALTMILYLWNAPHALDLPEYDEAAYFNRGYHLLLGDFQVADIGNPNTSPVSVIYYAMWYALLRTPAVYPLVMTSSLFLLGMGAYLLLSRILHPTLSWVLAIVAVVGSAPFNQWNANYYLGAGILWLSLSLLDQRVWHRGLAGLGVLVSVFARPEFELVLLALLFAMVAYEWRMWRRKAHTATQLALGYAPLLIGLLCLGYFATHAPPGDDNRTAIALPWSYTDYYRATQNPAFHGIDSYANPWVIFEHDFGAVRPRSSANALLALTRNPTKARDYVAFEGIRLVAAFGTSAEQSIAWRSNEWENSLPVEITLANTTLFSLYLVAFFAMTGAASLWLGQRQQLARLPIQRNAPALIGIASLGALLFALLLINPHQRFFMLFPLALLLIGVCLTLIFAVPASLLQRAQIVRRALPRPIQLAVLTMLTLALVLVATPQPYLATPLHPIERTVDFLKAHVPSGSTIVGEPVISYADYLEADGIRLRPLSPASNPAAGLVGAFEADPSLAYALFTRFYPQGTYDKWFADWDATFPQLPWRLVAQEEYPGVKLYGLPPHSDGYGRVSYALWQREAQRLNLVAPGLPQFDALDFDQALLWRSQTPRHTINPLVRTVGSTPAKCWVMHPYYSGIDAFPDVTWQDEASLPPTWAGRQVVFFAALAPWAANQPDAKGVKLTFSIQGDGLSQTVEVLNEPQQHWTPIVLTLPAYNGTATLTLSIAPRVSIANDTTLVSFIGVTAAAS